MLACSMPSSSTEQDVRPLRFERNEELRCRAEEPMLAEVFAYQNHFQTQHARAVALQWWHDLRGIVPSLAWRLPLGLLVTIGLIHEMLAQTAFSWQQIKDKFEVTNPTLMAAQ